MKITVPGADPSMESGIGEILITQYPQVKNGGGRGRTMAGKGGEPHPGKGGEEPDEMGRSLRARYKTTLVDKLTGRISRISSSPLRTSSTSITT